MKEYIYGMRCRGRGFGCQPKDFIDVYSDKNNKYFDILVYDRELTKKELLDYNLDFIKVIDKEKSYELDITDSM